LKREQQVLAQRLADLLLSADSPVKDHPALESLRRRNSELLARQASLSELDRKIASVLPALERAEGRMVHAGKTLEKEEKKLQGSATELGRAAFDALLSAEIADHPGFAARHQLQSRIDALVRQKSALAVGHEAKLTEKARVQAQQMMTAGQIKVEELKIASLDRAAGESLLASGDEEIVHCDRTDGILRAIAAQRQVIAAATEAIKQAESELGREKSAAAKTLDRDKIQNPTSLHAELKEIRKETRENQQSIDSVRHDAVATALEESDLREHGQIGLQLKQLQGIRSQLESSKPLALKVFDQFVARWRQLPIRVRYAACGLSGCVLLITVVSLLSAGHKTSHQVTPTASGLAETPDVQLPEVGPSKVPAVDRVAQDYKAARAVCVEARRNARDELRTELRVQLVRMQDEIKQGKVDVQEMTKSLQQLTNDRRKLSYSPSYDGGGPIPTHPVMRDAVKKYLDTIQAAYRKLGEVAGAGLAAYQKARITDPARLRPLLAARLAGEHAELLGIWEGDLAAPAQTPPEKGPQRPRPGFGRATPNMPLPARDHETHQIWIIDVDENSGGFRIGGVVQHHERVFGSEVILGVYHADQIELEGATLTFIAAPLDVKTLTTKPGGQTIRLKLQDGKVHYESRSGQTPAGTDLVRTDALRHRENFDLYREKTSPSGGSDSATDQVDLADANVVWRRVAKLTSFAYYRSSGWKPLQHEALYLPYRQAHPTNLPGLGGGLYEALTGKPNAAGVDRDRNAALLDQFEQLLAVRHPYLKKTTEQAMALCRNRLRIAMANEEIGNTGASQLKLVDDAFLSGLKYGLRRDADFAEIREEYERRFPGVSAVVTDAPMSPESKQKLDEFLSDAGKIKEIIQERSVVTGLLEYADMAQVDRSATFWKTWLLPLVRRCAGPVGERPLVKVDAGWGKPFMHAEYRSTRLLSFRLNNVAHDDLTHVVVELIAENEWGDKAAHYYYFDQLEGAEFVWLEPDPRWVKRRLAFTNVITATWSLWSDQGSEVGRQVELINPVPDPDSARVRNKYLSEDQLHQAEGEAFGALMQGVIELPFLPERQRRILREMVVPQKSYVLRLPGKTARTQVLRFLRFDRDQDTFEAEIFDADTKQPFKSESPVWKGKLNTRGEKAVAFRVEYAGKESWALTLASDEQPEIVCMAAGTPGALFPIRRIRLVPIK